MTDNPLCGLCDDSGWIHVQTGPEEGYNETCASCGPCRKCGTRMKDGLCPHHDVECPDCGRVNCERNH